MKKRTLLFSVTKKDFEIQTFRAGGPGGQHQNKTDSAVRIIHKESGAVAVARDSRSQHTNRKLAFRRLVNSKKFQLWIKRKSIEIETDKEAIKKKVEEMMKPENIKVEVLKDRKFVEESV